MIFLGFVPRAHLNHGLTAHGLPRPLRFLRTAPSQRLLLRSFVNTVPTRSSDLPKDPHPARSPPDASKISLSQGLKPEGLQKTQPQDGEREVKANDMLGQQIVSNKAQRKADWAIMKEMSGYLWPKVYQSNHHTYH